ncbi:NAD(P)/FAD-dependent oxidoreductase [Weissella ceti]|uniref:NAD(P)/FAD-dependent oxidoreductase n=1 Tax=Weissella ceti TaxID=759620 RepID=A0ABT3E3J2_9LACO|nr:NAD(P)/FAD-dependent oxidoreductase [Weissella ceti]MCW0952915.1 NAD(P)/FAD-dependent oxidoreductase [Weissella ceti]QVK11462.1 NAD(P)/FAD-dependent oxidoreductase [Weissella ceti]
MTEFNFDVLYIGSGHGTFDGAIPLAASGVKVGVIEADKVGGTCPNWGCNAKVLLEEAVKLQHAIEKSNGIISGETKIDWAKNQAHKNNVIDVLPGAIEGMMTGQGIEMIFGRGELVDAHTVQVGDKTYTADKIVISTGLRPHRLDVLGTELAHDSKDFLALSEMPAKMTVIGGGYVALESATMANAAGADVTLVLRGSVALRAFPEASSDLVLADLAERGVTIMRDTEVASLAENAGQITVTTTNGEIVTDYVLDATGRIANVENIGLENLGIQASAAGIEVNEFLQTSVENIYASGDVINKTQPKLTPTAIFESLYLMRRFSGQSEAAIDYPTIATNVFTTPRVAMAGVTVQAAEEQPELYTIVKHDVAGNWYRQVTYETQGTTTMIFNQEGNLVGVSDVSDRAEDIVNALLPAIEFKLSPEQISRLVGIFPSISFDVWGQI